MNKNVYKLLNNKLFLFIVSNLIYFMYLCQVYNNNFIHNNGQILFYEIIILFLITLFLNFIVYILFMKLLDNDIYKVFFFNAFFAVLLISFNYYLLFCFLLVFFAFKFFIKFSLKYIVYFSSLFILFVFIFDFYTTCCYLFYTSFKSVNHDNNFKINVHEKNKNPNIYWIHCDAMIGMDVMKKYFNYNNYELKEYFNSNNYIYNENARLMVGYSTRRALPALFNPNYYDNFYRDYLYDLENVYLEKKVLTDELVNYYELTDKRLHNELFKALKLNNYTTYGIGSFDQYTSLYTDYYYDYYNGNYGNYASGSFRLINYNDNKNRYGSYVKFLHFNTLLLNSYLKNVIDYNKLYFLKGKEVDYNDVNLDGYDYASSMNYVPGLTIFRGLNDIMLDDSSKKFIFIDYYINHMPLSYNACGDNIDSNNSRNILFYKGNYIYSANLLIDILNYIHNNDSEGIIIVQADHGLNAVKDDYIIDTLKVSNEEVQEIRNSVINAVYVPDKYRNGDEKYLGNPLNISRYLVNNYVGYNYKYIEGGVK